MKQLSNAWRTGRPARLQQGFTLVELMIGATIGLLSTLVIAGVLAYAEGSKRSATSGSDAQVNGGLAIYAIQRQLKMAGYGLMTDSRVAGCALRAKYGGTDVSGLPPILAPVIITAGNDGAPDKVRILSAAMQGFSLPLALTPPYYDPAGTAGKNVQVTLTSTIGISAGDLLALVYGADQSCQIFQASATVPGMISRQDSTTWNANQFPDAAAAKGMFVVNLGTFSDIEFSLTSDNKLRQTQFDMATRKQVIQDLQSNIVSMKALYGKDTGTPDDVVDTFDTIAPTNNAQWLQVRAVRMAIVARSAQYEKEEVTQSEPLWDMGKFADVPGSSSCGASKCITLKVSGASDWKHYRYKVFDVLVPLRNQLWRSDFSAAAAPPVAPASGNGS